MQKNITPRLKILSLSITPVADQFQIYIGVVVTGVKMTSPYIISSHKCGKNLRNNNEWHNDPETHRSSTKPPFENGRSDPLTLIFSQSTAEDRCGRIGVNEA